MNDSKPNKSRLDSIFVLTLFVLFAASLLIVTVYFAKIYRHSGERITKRFDESVTFSALTQKIRSCDHAGGIEVISQENDNVLKLNEQIDGTDYSTYIYYRDGSLYELFNTADTEFVPDYGMPMISADAFDITTDDDGCYVLKITAGNEIYTRHIAVKAGGATT